MNCYFPRVNVPKSSGLVVLNLIQSWSVSAQTMFQGTTKFDTTLRGNSNAGHDMYGNSDFTEVQRLELLEYLKSL